MPQNYVRVIHSATEKRLNDLRSSVLKKAQKYFSGLLGNYILGIMLAGEWDNHLLISLRPELSEDFILLIKNEILHHGSFVLSTVEGKIKVKILEEKIDSLKTSFKTIPSPVKLDPSDKKGLIIPIPEIRPQTPYSPPKAEEEKQMAPLVISETLNNQSKNQNDMSSKKLITLRDDVRATLSENGYTSKNYFSIVFNDKKEVITINCKTREDAEKIEKTLNEKFEFVNLKPEVKTPSIGLKAFEEKVKDPKKVTVPKTDTPAGQKKTNSKNTNLEAISSQIANLATSFEDFKKQSVAKGEVFFNKLVGSDPLTQLLIRVKSGDSEKLTPVSKEEFMDLFAKFIG